MHQGQHPAASQPAVTQGLCNPLGQQFSGRRDAMTRFLPPLLRDGRQDAQYGEACTAANRFLIRESVAEKFTYRFAAAMAAF
jgi:hypothetical protein